MSSSEEKTNAGHIDKCTGDVPVDASIQEYTPEEQKQIMRRVDRRLVTILGLLYMCSLMDRSNVGVAKIAGMTTDLNLVGARYNLIVLVFFIPYVLFQPLATVVMRKIGPRRFLSAITIFWGVSMIGFGFVQRWDQMLGLRVILGVFEAGYFPGCVYLLSTWYTRYELQKRNAVFFLIGSMANGLSGILAYGLIQMGGLGHLSGWRWIFIIEGLLTILFGILGALLIVDFPEAAHSSFRFLSVRESAFVVSRIAADRDDALPTPFTLSTYLSNALDLKIWAFALLLCGAATNTYAISFFLPEILHNSLHFSLLKTQCLIAPPYIAAALVMYFSAVFADRHHIRGPIIIFNACLGLIGLPLLGFLENSKVRYFGVFLATISANANVPAMLTYQANNIRGQWKRAFCSATLVGAAGIGGIVGSTVFREQDAPVYRLGILVTTGMNGVIVVVVLILTWRFSVVNRRGGVLEGKEGFKYTL
ncbi:MFS general substrate transporter [Stipitochalara longipes BDJ]|nr:MFS general substrate transporter [Stipitochalara longipes BDJ]